MLFCERAWLLFPFYPCPINCFILKKSALCRVGFNDIVYNNKHLLLIWHCSVQITSYLLGYFRIPMWSVKTSAWSVSGLKEIHQFWRSFRHAAKQNIFFLIGFKKKFSLFCIFQYFFINLPMLTMSETLSADAGYVPCGCPPKQKPAEGGMSCSWGAAWLWEHIYDEGVYLTLCSWHSEIWKISIIV